MVCIECGNELNGTYKELCRNCYDRYWYKNNKEKIKKSNHIYYLVWYKNHRTSVLEKRKQYYIENKDNVNLRNKKWISQHPEKDKQYQQKYRDNNRIKVRLSDKKWREKNPKYIIDYFKKRVYIDINFKLGNIFRCQIKNAIKNQKGHKSKKTLELLGCSIQQCREHLEKQFKSDMSWENYGKLWHIDHIIPCVYFDLKDEEQQKLCFHYTNLQPLWAQENLIKGCKIEE